VSAKRARNALEEHADDARLSKELSRLRSDVDLGVEIETLAHRSPDVERLRDLYKRLGFRRLLDTLESEVDAGEGARAPAGAEPRAVSAEIAADSAALASALSELGDEGEAVVLAIIEEPSACDPELIGLALALGESRAVYFPLPSSGARAAAPDTGLDVSQLAQIFRSDAGNRSWVGFQVKHLHTAFGLQGVELPQARMDLEIAGFLLDSSGSQELTSLALRHLGRELTSWEELAGRGAKAKSASELEVAALASWAGSHAVAMQELAPLLRDALEDDGLLPLFEEIEMPLTGVLSQMERNGVRVDEAHLSRLSEEYQADLERLEEQIYELAGERFLVSSPKQLQVILFEKLKLPPLKKTKTGYSTAEGVLEELAHHHELPIRILAWRRLSKLKSTYLDALPRLINERSARIHPHFHQTGAATGRLSCSDPNVQNIPIRTEEGIRIREAFVPAEGCCLFAADYSQVELRILAHYSGDQSLLDAFAKGEDIHRRTAAEVAGILVDEVSADQRARAKAVNFGIIYGSSAFGLANQLGIATGEAQEAIDTYFERYAGVARFLKETVVDAKKSGFVTTLLGRRRQLPDLASRNRVLRQAAERMAVNTVIQGTAADLIKRAMVDVDAALTGEGLSARMILQVHDELVFELPESELSQLAPLVRGCMEGVFELSVPLVVETGVGANWREAH
jgi:DNA polymerase-1